MYVDPYEKFLHIKPAKRVTPPAPTVPAERVGRARPEPVVEPVPEPAPEKSKRQRLSEERWAQIAELYRANPNRPLSSISRLVGCCHTTVYDVLNKLGIYRRRIPKSLVTKRTKLRMTPDYVSPQRLKIEERKRKRESGEASVHHSAKLTVENVRAMRSLHAQGIKIRVIAQRFSVSKSTAVRAVTGQSWKNV